MTPSRSLPLTPPHTHAEQYTCMTKLGAAVSKQLVNSLVTMIRMLLDKARHASKQRPSSKVLKKKLQEIETRTSTTNRN